MFQYVIAGLVLGGIYAIAATGLVVTFLSAGILNLSFAAMAYTVARFYYYLNSELHWSIVPSAILSIVVLGPAMGIFFYFLLFRRLHQTSTLVKILVTLGLSVALPSLDTVIFGTQAIVAAPGLAPRAGPRLSLGGCSGDPRSAHRLLLCRGGGGARCAGAALHRRGSVCPRHGGFPGHDVNLGNEPAAGVHVGVGSQRGAGRLDRRPLGSDHRARRGDLRCSWWPHCQQSSRRSSGAYRSRSSSGWAWALPDPWCNPRFPRIARSPRQCCLRSPSSPLRSSSSTS